MVTFHGISPRSQPTKVLSNHPHLKINGRCNIEEGIMEMKLLQNPKLIEVTIHPPLLQTHSKSLGIRRTISQILKETRRIKRMKMNINLSKMEKSRRKCTNFHSLITIMGTSLKILKPPLIHATNLLV